MDMLSLMMAQMLTARLEAHSMWVTKSREVHEAHGASTTA